LSLMDRLIVKARDRELRKCNVSLEQSVILFIISSIDHSPALRRYIAINGVAQRVVWGAKSVQLSSLEMTF